MKESVHYLKVQYNQARRIGIHLLSVMDIYKVTKDEVLMGKNKPARNALIKRMYREPDISIDFIAETFGISKSTVYRVRRSK